MEKISVELAMANGAQEVEILGEKYTAYFNHRLQKALQLDLGMSLVHVSRQIVGLEELDPDDDVIGAMAKRAFEYFHPELSEEDIDEMPLNERIVMGIYHAMLISGKSGEQITEDVDRAAEALESLLNSAGGSVAEVLEKYQGKKPLSTTGESDSK